MSLAAQHELLLQIIERPDDDQLRLVLADRLNEAADRLGELIIVQVTLERVLSGKTTGDYRALVAREAELLREHAGKWHQQAAPFARRLVMKRGLPHTLVVSANALLEDGGLTVLAPIRELELEQVDAEQLGALFALPLLRRVQKLKLPDLRGLARLSRSPGPLPERVSSLELMLDSARALDAALAAGLLDGLRELTLDVRRVLFDPTSVLVRLGAGRLSRLRRLTLLGARAGDLEGAWLDGFSALLERRPELTVVWRGIEHDAGSISRMVGRAVNDAIDEPAALPAERFSKEPYGADRRGGAQHVGLVAGLVQLLRSSGDELVATSPAEASFAIDAMVHLQLPAHPAVLEARAYDEPSRCLRYVSWAATALSHVPLPLPPGVALAVIEGVARGLEPLRAGLEARGLRGWPQALGLSEVFVGFDGRVKLLPPFLHTTATSSPRSLTPDPLGKRLDPELEETDDGLLDLLGTGLMHLVVGEPVSRRLRPAVIDPAWAGLDALVEGCLSPTRSARFASVAAFVEAVNDCPLLASQETVARAVRAKQSADP